jgi:hypothetical protein
LSSIRSPSGPPRSSQVAEVAPEPVWVGGHAVLAAAAGDHLVDTGSGQRFRVVDSEPQLRTPGPGVLSPGPEVPVEAQGRRQWPRYGNRLQPRPSAVQTGAG